MTMIIAHRGASGSAPENTMAAFRRAVREGAGWIELDVCATRDGAIVVIHDDTLDRTTNGSGRVESRTLAQLRRLDAGSFFHKRFAGEKIPTLREVVRFARGRKLGLFIEMKPGKHLDGRFERKLVSMLRRERMVNRAFVMSFDHAAVRRVKRFEPGLRCLLLVGNRVALPQLVRMVKRGDLDGVSFRAELATSPIVREFHRRGWTVVVWTVNAASEMRRFLERGVDGVTTNFPGRLSALVGARSRTRR